jgi:hypothetical protein
MSAFIVEDKTINRVITYLKDERSEYIREIIKEELGINLRTLDGQETLAREMFALNCAAVEERYGKGEAGAFRSLNYEYKREIANIFTVFKCLKCWQYQCSEGDIPETNKLYQVMSRVAGLLAESIVDALPAYQAAQGWN